MPNNLPNVVKGRMRTIRHCEDDPETGSWNTAASRIRNESRKDSCKAQMLTRMRRFANHGQLRSPDIFRKEGDLPNGKHFYAIKAGNIRAYGWFSRRHDSVFFISHYAYKNRDKLSQSDKSKVISNWRRFEEGGTT